jgi:hypothetical protein
MVVRGTGGALQTRVRVEEEIELGGVCNVAVDDAAGPNVATAILLTGVACEEADMMALLDDDEGDSLDVECFVSKGKEKLKM